MSANEKDHASATPAAAMAARAGPAADARAPEPAAAPATRPKKGVPEAANFRLL